MRLAITVLFWLLGIVLANLLHLPLVPLLLATGAALLLAALWRPTAWGKPTLYLTALLLGATRLVWAQPVPTTDDIDRAIGQRVVLRGTIAGQPDRREDRQNVVLGAIAIEIRGRSEARRGQIILQLSPLPELQYGANIKVSGLLTQPANTPSFDYRAYLQRQGITAVMKQPAVTHLSGFSGSRLLQPLLQMNDAVRAIALQLLPEPHASLLLGIILGVKATIPKHVLADFTTTGTSHILVISGWNITLVVVNAITLLLMLGLARRQADWAAAVILVLYVCFVGATPSVMRAAVMASLVILADLVGRPGDPWTLLLVACGLLTLLDPYSIWDVGFQLSALATAGLFAFTPALRELLQRIPFAGRSPLLIEPLAATLGASALTLPILLLSFGQLPLVAPLANLLLLPLVPFTMAFGTLSIVIGWLLPPLGQIVAFFTWPFLQCLLVGSHLLAKLSGTGLTPPSIDIWPVTFYYALLALAWVCYQQQTQRPRHGRAAGGMWDHHDV
ncbi:MAG: ComEC family competence protein [Herpetosiphonaceae bacterium]|nr:ComEC family competence protein [Herpetosiphonaceae bacterium]